MQSISRDTCPHCQPQHRHVRKRVAAAPVLIAFGLLVLALSSACAEDDMDMDDMASMYGERSEKMCTEAISDHPLRQWSQVSCRTFRSVVEEFFNVKSGDLGKALARAGHDKRSPWLHFENFDSGIDRALMGTAQFIAMECNGNWGEFKAAIKIIADSFQPSWIKWLVNDVFPDDKKLAKALGDGKWDFKLQDENDDYLDDASLSGIAQTGRAKVRVGSTRL